MADAFVLAFALFLIRFIASEAQLQRARRTTLAVHFPVGISFRVVYRLGGPFFFLVAYKLTMRASGKFDWVIAGLVASLGLACVLGEPGEIIAVPEGLVQKSLLGLRTRKIAWEQAAVSNPPGLMEILVVGRDGTTIVHTQYHVGHDELLQELERRHVFIQRIRDGG